MAKTCRVSTTCALIVCLLGAHTSATLSAEESTSDTAAASSSVVNVTPPRVAETSALHATLSPFTGGASRFVLSDETFAALTNAPMPLGGSFTTIPLEDVSLAQRGGYRGRRSRGGNGGAAAAIVVGAVAAIAGGAVLAYANRPECTGNRSASGCGYGTKVIGGSVLAGGLVGVVVGAANWR